jgi:hypothetical protein
MHRSDQLLKGFRSFEKYEFCYALWGKKDEAVVAAYFKLLSRHLPEGTKENYEISEPRNADSPSDILTQLST